MTRPRNIQLPAARPAGLRFDVPAVVGGCFEVSAASGEEPSIGIFDAIGFEVTASAVDQALRRIGNRPVTVKINSPGGDFFEGATIYNQLRAHPGRVTVQVLGLAASAASVIAMAGERIEIARNAQVMVHRAWLLAIGNRSTMAEATAFLDTIDASIADTYAERTGQPRADVVALMEAETFLPSDQALKLGFADQLLDRDADPPPRTTARAAIDIRNFEASLRDLGFSKVAAARIAAGGWPALGGSPGAAEDAALAKRINEARAELAKSRNSR